MTINKFPIEKGIKLTSETKILVSDIVMTHYIDELIYGIPMNSEIITKEVLEVLEPHKKKSKSTIKKKRKSK